MSVITSARAVPSVARTLAIDIGGTGLKAIVLASDGKALTDRVRVETPHPATPEAILAALWKLIEPLGDFQRVSVGFPGVVIDGVTLTAPNLDEAWDNYDLARAITEHTKRPAKVLNDAGVQGYGVIAGRGVEMMLSFGTGLGCALYHDGIYVPNLELAHHPFKKGKTYEDYVGKKALDKIGKRRWNRRVRKVVEQVLPIWNPRHLYLGGGNAKHIKIELPPNVSITQNIAGLMGGIALWHDAKPS
jgi:polyphosphate glucokinase